MSINDKIKQVLTLKQLSPSQLADAIGVQRSSISHILSGRNRPSLDIIQKIVRCYDEFTYDWFLEGDDSNSHPSTDVATCTKSVRASSHSLKKSPALKDEVAQAPVGQSAHDSYGTNVLNETESRSSAPTEKQVERILVFFSDGTFREYKPS